MYSPVVIASRSGADSSSGVAGAYEIHFGGDVSTKGARFGTIGFQGFGVIGSVSIGSASDLDQILTSVWRYTDLEDLFHRSTGAFTCQIYDWETGDVLILSDPLGSGVIFEYVSPEVSVYGTSIKSVRRVLDSIGVSLERDVFYEISKFATGTANYAADTPFKCLTALRPGECVHVSLNGTSGKFDIGMNRFRRDHEDADYQELIESGVEQILDNVRAIDGASPFAYSDITGGFDSRLVLAALIKADLKHSISLTSYKYSNVASGTFNPEWQYASGLAASVGFPLSSQRFLEGAPSGPSSLTERAFAGARMSGGLIENGMDPLVPKSRVLTLQGGFGETFRTFSQVFVENGKPVDWRNLLEGVWKWTNLYRATVGQNSIFTDSLEEVLLSRVQRLFSPSVVDDMPNDYLSNHLYLNSRNRYWIGQQSYWRSTVQRRFDPLYNMYLILAAERLSFFDRRANFVGLDAMAAMAPELLGLPFYNKNVLNARWVQSRGSIKVGDFSGAAPQSAKVVQMPVSPARRLGSSDVASDEEAGLARRIGRAPGLVAGVMKWRTAAREDIMGNAELREIFNDQAIDGLLNSEIVDGQQLDLAVKLITGLMRSGFVVHSYASEEDSFLFG